MVDLSIVTITYNDSTGLRKTIDSVTKNAKKTALNIEFIIVDGSEDICLWNAAISEFDKTHLKYISGPDLGVFDAMNKGVDVASNSKYIYFLNSGDQFSDETVLNSIEELIFVNSYPIIAGRVMMSLGELFSESDLYPWVCHQSVFCKTNLIKKYKFNHKLKFFGDLDLWLRLRSDNYFNPFRVGLVISKFELGGIGNSPSHLWERLRERNTLQKFSTKSVGRFFYTFYLYVVYKIFGTRAYFRVLSKVN
ncbi:glycosyltransferase [Planktomarina temperata]|nr:glycosyltransferase [Planktomarina temperata]